MPDRIPLCRTLHEQLDCPLEALRHTLAFVVETPEILDRILRLKLGIHAFSELLVANVKRWVVSENEGCLLEYL